MNSKIISLESANIKRIKAISITPDGNMVVIGGRNAQGKSSVLDSIEYGLRGGKALPQKPLREGEEHGHVVIETEDLVINRTFTSAGNSNLVIRNRQNGLKLNSPQAILDKLSGDLTFDPLAFSRMKPTAQKEVLQNLLGLDFTELNSKRDALFAERTMATREEKSLEARYSNAPHYPDCKAKVEASASALADELKKMTEHNNHINSLNDGSQSLSESLYDKDKELEELHAKAKMLLASIDDDKAKVKEIEDELRVLKPADTSEVEHKLSEVDTLNAQVRANAQYKELEKALTEKHEATETMTKAIAEIDEEKEHLIFSAPMPVEGLAFSDEGVTFNGIPFSQCSSAEQLKISVAMGAALAPELKIMLIRDGSLLDEDSLRTVGEMADKFGMQVWLEKVGEGKEVSVILEDGSVKE